MKRLTLGCPDRITVRASAPFMSTRGEVFDAYVTIWIEGTAGGGLHLSVSRTIAQAEALLDQLQRAIEEAKAMPADPVPACDGGDL